MLNPKASEQAIKYLLTYIPLFNRNFNDLKPIYSTLLKRIHTEALNNNLKSVSSYNEYYNLLILASIHPAFNADEQIEFENNAKAIQKKFQTSYSGNLSHHDYNLNDENCNDLDEGFCSNSTIATTIDKKSGIDSSCSISTINDVNTPNRYLSAKIAVTNCLSAPPNMGNNNSSENDENTDDDDDDDDDEVDDDDDDDENSDDNDVNKSDTKKFDENNNDNFIKTSNTLLFGK